MTDKLQEIPLPEGQLYALPSNWQWVTLGDLTSIIAGGTPSTQQKAYFGGPIPWVTPADLSGYEDKYIGRGARNLTQAGLSASSARLLPKDTVLMSSRAPIGYIAIASNPIATNQGFKNFLPNDNFDPEFLYYYLRGSRPLLESLASGTTFKELSGTRAKQIPFPLPPLPEQKRIVAKLDSLLGKIKEARQLIEEARETFANRRAAILAKAFRGELTAKWREENPEVEPAEKLLERILEEHFQFGAQRGNAADPTEGVHDLTLDGLPPSWRLIELRHCVRPDRPITYGILKPGPDVSRGVPYVKVVNYPNDEILLSKLHRTSKEIAREYARAQLRAGDLLLSIRGTVGRVASVPAELDGGNITQDSARLSVIEYLHAPYVQLALQEPFIKNRMSKAIKGVAVRGINIGDVRALQIALPPVAEQVQIVRLVANILEHLSAADTVSDLDATIDSLEKSILARAFRGELGTGDDSSTQTD